MNLRPRTAIALSCLYWAGALTLGFLALGAPCGLAPGIECDTQGQALLWRILGVVGPLGVLLPAIAIYFAAVRFNGRGKKGSLMFKKILVADCGEIACHVFRTAKKLGTATVEVQRDVREAAE